MLQFILILLILLWLFGLIQIPFLNRVLFSIANHPFTLHSLLFFFLILFVIGMLPGTVRTIALILLVLWLLSIFGVFSIAGLPQILLLILIIAVIFSIF